jgi:hypothetical protein
MSKRGKKIPIKIHIAKKPRYRRVPEPWREVGSIRPLEYQLCEILQSHAGERGHDEGAVDCLCRIIRERDRALLILALDRLGEPQTAGNIFVRYGNTPCFR